MDDRTCRPPPAWRRPAFICALNFTQESDDFQIVLTLRNPIVALASPRARIFLVALAVMACLLAGCRSRGPTQKEQAHAKWNDARAQVLLNLANEQYTHGNLVEARKSANDGLKMTERLAGLYILSAKLDIDGGNLQAASAAIEMAQKLSPRDPEPDYLAGIVAERWQNNEEAVLAYRAASEKRPEVLAYLLALSEALMVVDRPYEAAAALEPKLVYFESSAPIRDMLGQVYQEMDRHEEAAELFRQATVLAPDDTTLRERHALALMQSGQHGKAADQLERLVGLPEHSQQVSLHVALAECRMQQGNFAVARVWFQRATRIDPQNTAAWLGLGKAALETDDLERVGYALQQAEALRPAGKTAADVALLRGYLHLREERPGEAAKSFASAIRHDPEDPMPLIMYGYCRQKLGDLEQARQYYTRALEIDPTDALAHELMGSLATADRDLLP